MGQEHAHKGADHGKKCPGAGIISWEIASEEEKERRREGGRQGAAVAIANYHEEQIEEQRQA